MPAYKILFVTSEAHPLIKTGGLGDVSASLPLALHALGHEVRLILPAYRAVMDRVTAPACLLPQISGHGIPAATRLLQTVLPGSTLPVWLVDCPTLFDRPGNPYTAPNGADWPDNALRYAVYARAVCAVATGHAGLAWQPDVVHANDWQTGLVPALLARRRTHPAAPPTTLFTIHNLAYQGLFPAPTFQQLELPEELWGPQGLEFYGHTSFIKGGLVYADWLTTVSPTYAQEIRTPTLGYGLDGLLNHRTERLTGIVNGIDTTQWDPNNDPHLPHPYSAHALAGKARNKAVLQAHLGLPVNAEIPLMVMVSRMVEQKGFDLLLEVLDEIVREPVQLAVLGSGESRYQDALLAAAQHHPSQLVVRIGFDEALSHLMEGGGDFFLMPSLFEPCGLNQMYSLRYGTVPIVRRTGGLADTVVDATPQALSAGTATGFVFDQPTSKHFYQALQRGLAVYRQPTTWQKLMRNAMAQDFSWARNAQAYATLYGQAIAACQRPTHTI